LVVRILGSFIQAFVLSVLAEGITSRLAAP